MIMRTIRTIGRVLLGLVVSTLISIAPMRAADTVTIGTVGSPSANLWPLFIGLDKGFFAAENLKIDVVYVPASAAVIQQQIGHLLEGFSLERSGVFALPLRIFVLALQRFGISPRAPNGVPVILLRLHVVDDDTPSAALSGWVFLKWDAFDHGGSAMT